MDSGDLYTALLREDLPQVAAKRLVQTSKEKQTAAILSLVLGIVMLSLAATIFVPNKIWGISIAGLGIFASIVSLKCYSAAKADKALTAEAVDNTIDRLKLEKLQKADELMSILAGEYACHVFRKETHVFGTKILFNGQAFPTGTLCILTPSEFALVRRYIPNNTIKFQKQEKSLTKPQRAV